jgi:hypothetical protein
LARTDLSDECYAAILTNLFTHESFSGVRAPEGYSFIARASAKNQILWINNAGSLGEKKRDKEGNGREGKRRLIGFVEWLMRILVFLLDSEALSIQRVSPYPVLNYW